MEYLFRPVVTELLTQPPERRALEFGAVRWSYGKLANQSLAVARWLASQRYPRESLVAVSLDRSPEMVATLIGILRAGLAFLPIDPDYPEERKRFMLVDAAPVLLVADHDGPIGPSLENDSVDVHTVTLSELMASAELSRHGTGDLATEGCSIVDATIEPRDLAYAIYTSGSSGQPKAALLEHAGLSNLVAQQRRRFGTTPLSRVLQFASTSFDAAVSEIFVTLAAGATLCLAPRTQLVPGPRLAHVLRSLRITDVTLPPSVLAHLDPATLPELRTLVVAGEACSAGLVSRWAPGRRMINAYGPTEATICVTTAECRPDVAPPPIGNPLDGVEAWVLDDRRMECDEGELYVTGVGVGRGYLNRPDLTAASFLNLALPNGQTERAYRTGDRVRRNDDGMLSYIGRIDDQVKLHGVRVDPGEIAHRIESNRSVRYAYVCAEQCHDQIRLIGFVEWMPGVDERWDDIWQSIRAFLPVSHWPAELVPVSEFPLMPNGKVDRQQLLAQAGRYRHGRRDQLRLHRVSEAGPGPSHTKSRFNSDASGDADVSGRTTPRQAKGNLTIPDDNSATFAGDTSREAIGKAVDSAWTAVLGTRPTSEQDFFLSGGDSLAAIELLTRLEERTGHRVTVGEFVLHPTRLKLVDLMTGHSDRRDDTVVPIESEWVPISASPHGRPFVCFHPGGGHVFCYRQLARELGDEWSVYGLQAGGLNGRTEPQRSIGRLADRYAEIVERRLNGRSVSLCGWSYGGLVAYEVALRLARRGRLSIDRLWILDAGPLYSFVVLRNLFPDNKLSLRQILRSDRQQLRAYFEKFAQRAHLVPHGAPEWEVDAAFRVFMANVDATAGYRLPTYDGTVHLILAEEALAGLSHDVVSEWRSVVSDLRVRYTEGDHLTMMESPCVKALARRIRLAQIVDLGAVRRHAA